MTIDTDSVDAEVVIVGDGPVGATLAILLAQLGRTVTIVERWPAPYGLPRAVHFDEEVGRILQSCGIGDELAAISEPAPIYEWRNASGTTLLRLGRVGDGASGWPMSSMFSQPVLEGLLDRRVAGLPGIEIRRGVEVSGLQMSEAGVTASTVTDDRIRGRYVVGCDGANSTVRTLAGLPTHDLGFFYDWLIVDVVLDAPRVFDPLNVQICDPARPTTAVSGGPGRRRWEFMRLPHETVTELNNEQRAWELLEPWDVHAGNARLERHAVYTFSARYAERWRSGRVLIAGDAAHLMPPFAGQGLCAGIRDAANLAWKLDHVLAGTAADGLLDTYEAERLPQARQAIEFSIELGKVICVPDPAEAAARDELMAAGVTDEPGAAPLLPDLVGGLVHPAAPHAGAMFIQRVVEGGRYDDVNGAGWQLVTVAADMAALDSSAAERLAALGGTVTSVASYPEYVEWFRDHDTTWALQRPDFYLYGTASSAAQAGDLVTDLRRQLSGGDATMGATL